MELENNKYELYQGDCIEIMDLLIEQNIQVDLTVTSHLMMI